MLAQNFKTAKELFITEKEHRAAIVVLGMLERNELVHFEEEGSEWDPNIPNGFNMACAGETNECGTVGCIGGWMAIAMGKKSSYQMISYVQGSHCAELAKLFFGYCDHHVTVEQAARALRNFLTFGDADWDNIKAEEWHGVRT